MVSCKYRLEVSFNSKVYKCIKRNIKYDKLKPQQLLFLFKFKRSIKTF